MYVWLAGYDSLRLITTHFVHSVFKVNRHILDT